MRSTTTSTTKTRQVRLSAKSLSEIEPSPENDRLYRPIDPTDSSIKALANSIVNEGILEPLVVTLDGYILSGHRRHAAAKLAGLDEVPCRVVPIRRTDDIDLFVKLLRDYNLQREKSIDEKLREEIVSADPFTSYQALLDHRREAAEVQPKCIELRSAKRRKKISNAKRPMLNTAIRIIEDLKDRWPVSVRQVHYKMLNHPPLRHASKPGSRYRNDLQSYKDLDDILVRARVSGLIPMDAIADETRPVTTWRVYGDPAPFIREEIGSFLRGYYRDLMRSQPVHIELLVEKNTVLPIIRRVAEDYCIPITSGRGFSSLPPMAAMVERFEKSGKDKLVLIIVADFDPEGEEIGHSFARTLRDEFGIDSIHAIKAALTSEQVRERNLPQDFKAKVGSANYKRFVGRYGATVAELEALEPDDLEQIVRDAVDSVLDHDALEAERTAEANDAGYLRAVHRQVRDALADLDTEGGEHG